MDVFMDGSNTFLIRKSSKTTYHYLTYYIILFLITIKSIYFPVIS